MRLIGRVLRAVAVCVLVMGQTGPLLLAAQDHGPAVLLAQDDALIPSPPGADTALGQQPRRQEYQEPWRGALVAIPVAAALGAALAFRPIRRGTPPRDPAVIQTQIVLAVVGAIIMLVVGASLARAFGIVGAASLVRYRAKVGDPKDAAVMLAALGVGLASGVGIYLVAAISTTFVLLILWALESFEPRPLRDFTLKVSGKQLDEIRPDIERLLRQHRVRFDLRTGGHEEVAYDVRLPVRRRTERLTNEILALEHSSEMTVEWKED